MTAGGVLAVLGALSIVVGLGASALAGLWTRGQRETLDMLKDGSEALRDRVSDLEAQLVDQEAQCQTKLEELSEQVQALRSGMVREVAHEVGREFAKQITAAVAPTVQVVNQPSTEGTPS